MTSAPYIESAKPENRTRDNVNDLQTLARDLDQDKGSMFINVTESPLLDKESRTKVRVQVMRDYHQRRIQKTGKSITQDISQSPVNTNTRGKTQKFRLGKENFLKPWVPVKSKAGKQERGLKSRVPKKQPAQHDIEQHLDNLDEPAEYNNDIADTELPVYPASIWETSQLYVSPGTGMLDPFSAMAVLITPRTQLLLHHYFSDRLHSSWLMMPMRKTLFSLAVHDTAMFHSFLCHYATNFNVRFKTSNSSESIYHATMAASLVNQKLTDPSQALTDETIGTVANMAAYESSNGSMSSMVIHMDGLEKMVNLRGGLHEGGFSMIIQRMIGWADYHVATAALQKPRFPPLLLPETVGPKDDLQNLKVDDGQHYVFKDSSAPNFEQLASAIKDLAEKLRIVHQKPVLPSEDIWYSDKIYFLQRHLFDIAHGCSNATPVDRVCALAALIYCGHCLRDIPLTYAVTANAITRLQSSLELLDTEAIEEWDFVGKYFWVLGFGGVAAEHKSEENWFVGKFRLMSDQMRVADWPAARFRLNEVLWDPGLDIAGQRLWEASRAGQNLTFSQR